MDLIMNRLFLHFQCKTVDFILYASLHMDQWLNACVATERATATIKGVNFNKEKSKQVAKLAIIALVILTAISGIHDPLHRRLLDDNDDDQRRIWCIVSYSYNIQIFNKFIEAIHFFVPFALNLISALIVIIIGARRRATVKQDRTYKEHIIHQFRQHRNLLIAPLMFVLLIFPRIIIAFASGCMKSSRESTIYLAGYLISFIPPILTFVVFVIPSKVYTAEFIATVKKQRRLIRMYINRIMEKWH
ncbi:unnamed protein product [Rotaria socialis]|uniref:G-protein coupled receptors family 1 profile domain-containing protein n=1 Tax=Rotaria socialis TaxID=392032 RepID=A0A821D151_9BILA|nr:unnamed protein product [Rotaria socialis]CAF4614904.1 unnamed protein product [Rotaria socialis]